MSPAKHAYLDMKYDAPTPLGLTLGRVHVGAGRVRVGPGDVRPASARGDVLGVEAPLWTETMPTIGATSSTWRSRGWPGSPRSAGRRRAAGVGRVPAAAGRAGAALDALGINYYRAPEIPWR